MNNLSKFRMWLIAKIAGDEPILLNWRINSALVKGGASTVFIPLAHEKLPLHKLSSKAVLTPIRNEA